MDQKTELREVRVKASTEVPKLAGSLLTGYEKNPDVQIRVVAMGAGALNQAIKGVITFNEYLIKRGCVAYIMPAFHNFPMDGKTMTSIEMQLKIQRL